MDPVYWWGHGFGFMWLIPLFFVVMLIVAVRCMLGRGSRSCCSHEDKASRQENAREILDKRFAKGDITKEEYEQMKESLEGETVSASKKEYKEW